jgi:FtsZ-binding cell division protein ZapB
MSGDDSQLISTNALKEHHNISEKKNHEFQVLSDDTNASIQLREVSQAVMNDSHVSENSSIETTLHSSVSSSFKTGDLGYEKGLEEVPEELEEHSEMVSAVEKEVQEEEEERYSELNSTVHSQISGPIVQESLYVKPELESVIQELLVSKQQSSYWEFEESAGEVESIPEEISELVSEVEENKERSVSVDQDVQDAGQQSDSLNHSEERVISSLKDSVQRDTCGDRSDDVGEDILEVEEEIPEAEEEIEKNPETEEEIPELEEDIPKTEESNNSLNVVSEVSEIFFHKDFQETDHNCDVNKVKEKGVEEIAEKVERITDVIFQKLLNESLRSLHKKGKKHNKSTLEVCDRNEYRSQLIEETGKEVDSINQTLINKYEKDSSVAIDMLDKQNEDKNVDRVDNITNAILEQLLVESSFIFYSKKSKIDGSGNIYGDSESRYKEEGSTGDEACTGN